MCLRDATLMVTQYGNHTVGFIIRVELLLEGRFLWCVFIQLLLERDGGVIGTEHLRSEALHV